MTGRFRGFSLIELSVVVAVAALAITIATPSWRAVTDRHRLVSATEQVTSLLVTAQSESIKRNTPVALSFSRSGDTEWCVGVVANAAGCDCSVTDSGDSSFCGIDGVERRLDAGLLGNLKLEVAADTQPGGGDERIVFDPVRGILDPPGDKLDLRFASDSGSYKLQVEIGPTGNLRLCRPADADEVNGYPTCAS